VNKHQGFTLIELLIASSILMMILLLGTYSYSLFADKWNKQLGHVNKVVQQVRTLTLLDQLLDGVVPLVLNENAVRGFYFNGAATQLTAISLNGIIRSAQPVVFRLSTETQINGTQQIWYEEAGLKNLLILTEKQAIPFDEPLLLLKNLTQTQFSYFGWESFEVKSQAAFENDTSKRPIWLSNYDGQTRQLQPEKLALMLLFKKTQKETQAQTQVNLNSRYTQNSELLLRDFEGG
jgi:prepilin-type N-terminal cleavage/methylation domain-containing protein